MTLVTKIKVDAADKWLGEDVPPEHMIPEPERFLLLVKQYGVKRKIGSIELPDQLVDAQSYTHGLGLVVKAGKGVYQGRKFEDLGLSADDAPKPGQLVTFEARGAPRRIWINGIELLFIADDSVTSRVLPEQAQHISFKL